VTYDAHLEIGKKILSETEPDKLKNLSPVDLERCRDTLSKVLEVTRSFPWDGRFGDRIEVLRREIEMRRIEEHSERHHRELFGKAKWTLFWAAIGGVTGIALVLLAIWPLIHDTLFSKALPASEPQATPAQLPQIQSTTNVSPEPEASASSATPSPQLGATGAPSP
jgi:hypothetical protein